MYITAHHYIYETLGGVLKRTGFFKKTLKKVLTFAVACGIIIKHSGEGGTKESRQARENEEFSKGVRTLKIKQRRKIRNPKF